jgi:hypothetical protein
MSGAGLNLKTRAKKLQKKLVTPPPLPLEGNFEGQMPSFRRSKKIQKSEKKSLSGPQTFNNPVKT